MSQTTDAVIAELMDRRLLNDVDSDLHQEIAEAVIKAAQPEVKAEGGRGDLTPEQISIVNDMIIAWIDPEKLPQYREAFRNDCKRLLRTTHPASPPDAEAIRADERNGVRVLRRPKPRVGMTAPVRVWLPQISGWPAASPLSRTRRNGDVV